MGRMAASPSWQPSDQIIRRELRFETPKLSRVDDYDDT